MLPKAIMCDIDGTLAHGIMVTRKPYEWHKVDTDSYDDAIGTLIGLYHREAYTIILMSGRDSSCRELTEDWLKRHGVRYDHLYMRAQGDNRPDNEIKAELYRAHIEGKYHVEFVLDDRNRVVKTWRDLGLRCFQVAEGDF